MNKSEPTAKKKRGQRTEAQMKLAIDKVRSSLGDRLTKLKEGEMVKTTQDMCWFRRTFTNELEEKTSQSYKRSRQSTYSID
jgi:hypothetical protein